MNLLQLQNTLKKCLPTIITNESTSDKNVIYNCGSIFMIISCILIADLLAFITNLRDIDGILIMYTKNIIETQTEAFITRIYYVQ